MVVLYILWIGMEVEIESSHLRQHEQLPEWLSWISTGFLAIFSLEIAAHTIIERRDYWMGSGTWWNYLDLVLIIGAWVDNAVRFLSMSKLRAIRIVQAFRALRLLRSFRIFQKLRQMMASVLCSISSLAWALGFLTFVLYIFAVIILQGVGDHYQDSPSPEVPFLRQHYGSLGGTMLSLFMAISGGKDWVDLYVPLQGVSGAYAGIFVLYVAFTLFGMVNILTAIFVESANEISSIDRDLVAQQQLESDRLLVEHLRAHFEATASAAAGGAALLAREAFDAHMAEARVLGSVKTMGLDPLQVRGLYELLEGEDGGGVDVDEFVCALVRLRSGAKGIDIASLMYENQRLARQISALRRAVEPQLRQLAAGVARLRPGAERVHGHPRAGRAAEAPESTYFL